MVMDEPYALPYFAKSQLSGELSVKAIIQVSSRLYKEKGYYETKEFINRLLTWFDDI